EGGWRTQFAGAERCQRPARGLDVFCDLRTAFGPRHRPVEAHSLDLISGIGGRSGRILKNTRNEAVVAGGKIARHVGPCFLSSERQSLATVSNSGHKKATAASPVPSHVTFCPWER